MSQQINLLLAELRPRRDWLALPVVLAAALAGMLVLGGFAVAARLQVNGLKQEQSRLEREFAALQPQVLALGQALAARKASPALQQEIDTLRAAVQQREGALHLVDSGQAGSRIGFSALFAGFARQVMPGVWLVGFRIQGDEMEIRGRLTDPALLPAYIRKLESDAAFQGRRFAALDMQGVQADAARRDVAAAARPGPAAYTEFVLKGTPAAAPAAGGQRE